MEYKKPFFSVIIPTFNREVEILRCLDSVFNQTFADFEVIVVDDHSTDNTLKVLNQIQDDRLIICSNHRKKGACGARNTGIEISRGKYLAFLDSDDFWDCEKLQECLKFFKKSSFEAIYSGYSTYRGNYLDKVVDGFSGNHLLKLYSKNIIRGTSLLVIRKELMVKIGFFDESLLSKQDLDLYIRISKKADFGYIPKVLVHINTNSDNRISDNSEYRFYGLISFYRKYKIELPNYSKIVHLKSLVYYSFKCWDILKIVEYGIEFLFIKLKNK